MFHYKLAQYNQSINKQHISAYISYVQWFKNYFVMFLVQARIGCFLIATKKNISQFKVKQEKY